MRGWLLLVAACGRVGFVASHDAALGDAAFGDVAVGDVEADASSVWGAPQMVDLGITSLDDPSMTSDGLEIYVNCGTNVCGSERVMPGDVWTTAVMLTSLPAGAYSPHLSADGLTLWVVQIVPPSAIYVTTRGAHTDSWGALQSIPEITSGAGDDGPAVTNDGLVMVFDSLRNGSQAIFITSRPTTAVAWATPTAIAEINAVGSVARPHLTDDRLSIYFQGPGLVSGGDIWYAHRATATDPFDPPQRVTEVNTSSDEQDPWVSADQRTLLVSSNRDGLYKIWQALR
jgi:hypothetical protein